MEDLLQCPICYVDYNNTERSPRQLNNCQHILCSVCLPHMLKIPSDQRKFIECPICKDKLFVEISQVPKSLVLMQVMDVTRQSANSNLNSSNWTSTSNNLNQTMKTVNNFDNRMQNNNTANSSRFFSPPVIPPRSEPVPGLKSTNPFYSDYNQNHSFSDAPQSKTPEPWDTRKFLKNIFNQMDTNNDGKIMANELQEALRRSLQMNDFNLKTIQLLISRYDKNGDMEISFEEFFDLFCNMNEEYENFLIMDQDGSGYVSCEEFSQAMNSKGYNFSPKFFKFIVGEIGKHSHSQGIKFDNYIRAMARFDYLCEYYRKTPYFHNNHNLESYLKNTFFQDFW